ncbi:MAG: SDR family NAD(P)-dependent oxidoreductase, partial [Rhodospirillaceae bacterium]|nr:SDR family NAD(P)-dependent oxidoreductase [Rhodospirillaceae bacterium]
IVNIGSIFGLHAIGSSVYGASKGAVHVLSQDLRHDLKGTGIRVTEVSPGRTATEIFATMTDDQAAQTAMAEGFEIITAEDVAEAVVWALDQPWRVNVSLIELTATEQIPGGVGIHPVT